MKPRESGSKFNGNSKQSSLIPSPLFRLLSFSKAVWLGCLHSDEAQQAPLLPSFSFRPLLPPPLPPGDDNSHAPDRYIYGGTAAAATEMTGPVSLSLFLSPFFYYLPKVSNYSWNYGRAESVPRHRTIPFASFIHKPQSLTIP